MNYPKYHIEGELSFQFNTHEIHLRTCQQISWGIRYLSLHTCNFYPLFIFVLLFHIWHRNPILFSLHIRLISFGCADGNTSPFIELLSNYKYYNQMLILDEDWVNRSWPGKLEDALGTLNRRKSKEGYIWSYQLQLIRAKWNKLTVVKKINFNIANWEQRTSGIRNFVFERTFFRNCIEVWNSVGVNYM